MKKIKDTKYFRAIKNGNKCVLKVDLIWDKEKKEYWWVNGIPNKDIEWYLEENTILKLKQSMRDNWDYSNVVEITKEEFKEFEPKEKGAYCGKYIKWEKKF